MDNYHLSQTGCDLNERLDAISRLSANISHKLNNHLTYMYNYMFILKNNITDPAQINLANKIENGLNRIRDILQELIDISSPSLDNLVQTDVASLSEEVVQSFSREISERGIDISISGNATVITSRKKLLKALMNMVNNSIESEADKITISHMEGKENITISINDNGSGIKIDDKEMLFEPFFTSKQNAKGMGLYIAVQAIKSIGGTIALSSSANDKGAEFIVTLPK